MCERFEAHLLSIQTEVGALSRETALENPMKKTLSMTLFLAISLLPPTLAVANDRAIGALIGGGAGAVIGNAIGGRNATIVGGVLGAVAGAAIAAEDRDDRYDDRRVRYYAPQQTYYPPRTYYEPQRAYYPPPPRQVYYDQPPQVYYAPPPQVYYTPPRHRVVVSPPVIHIESGYYREGRRGGGYGHRAYYRPY